MGLSRGLRGLLALNQPGGIDCMSCAWADPDQGRGIVEFCENGVKALAWEGDTDRAGPEFFAQHSLAELAQRSDYWLGQQGRLTHPMVLRYGGTHYQPIPWEEASSLIARVVPGFDQYNERVRKPGGFYLPNQPRQGHFPTKSGRRASRSIPCRRIIWSQANW